MFYKRHSVLFLCPDKSLVRENVYFNVLLKMKIKFRCLERAPALGQGSAGASVV